MTTTGTPAPEPISLTERRIDKPFDRLLAAVAARDDDAMIAAFLSAGIPPYARIYDDGRIEPVVCVACGAPLGDPDPDDEPPGAAAVGCRGDDAPTVGC